jgi:predicted alpha/beta hydrolase
MWAAKLALILATLYIAVIAVMYLAQTWLIFPANLAGLSQVQLPPSAQHLEVRTPKGEALMGVRIPAKGERAQSTSTLIGFGGNAWNAEAMALYLHGLFPDHDVVTFHYRGYAPSRGSRAQRHCSQIRFWSSIIYDSQMQASVLSQSVSALALE